MTFRLPFELDLTEPAKVLGGKETLSLVNLANPAAKSFTVQRLLEHLPEGGHVLWASQDEQADDLAQSAACFLTEEIHLVPREVQMGDFYQLQRALGRKRRQIFLFEDIAAALASVVPSKVELKKHLLTVTAGETVEIFKLFGQLEAMGYEPAEDRHVRPGEFLRTGENLLVYPLDSEGCYRLELFGDEVERITKVDTLTGETLGKAVKKVTLTPVEIAGMSGKLMEWLEGKDNVFISDDLDQDVCEQIGMRKLKFTTFPQEEERFFHLNFFSVLPFYTLQDFVVDMKERLRREYTIVIATKRLDEVEGILQDKKVMYTQDLADETPSTLKIIPVGGEAFLPHSFQNNEQKILFLTDREIFQFSRRAGKAAVAGMNVNFVTSLKPNDYVVHSDHGLAQFGGIVQRDMGDAWGGIREYLKLEYAHNDKLYLPVESAEKVVKFIGDDVPKLTRLGSAEWAKTQRKIKKETEKIAGDLLKLYAAREMARGQKFVAEDERLKQFCQAFPYELTPGQASAWADVQRDMESPKVMDRLVCGDVGFGKTEIAMRSAFKAFVSGKQAAILAPITILAEQHYESLMKRIGEVDYGVRVALLTRFQTAAEQKKIIVNLKTGLVDIIIGTHRLLSKDIDFENLGLLVIDEEQRFGVKQKEKIKKLRANVDLLTMTATPIPRTLNMSLNKLKDISTITTPPPGRLPVVTEVRKYNLNLIRERILLEIERGGQVYFLHNEVKTIEGQTMQLRALIPEAKFIIAHGQLSPQELEKRIHNFKEGKAHVLVASTIIENGIDLARANTLLVNRAEKFGLSQLYQLRGRVGRSRTQAYAYFLYHGQKLEIEARKRLRAIVEAAELGSGFQIAMRDLEIRGAGEVLGASQSGAMKTVGVSHFIRMLNKTIEKMKAGELSEEIEETENITVEVPLSAYIPATYIPSSDEKIRLYQELAGVTTEEGLRELRLSLKDDYGTLPEEVENLIRVIRLKLLLRDANLVGVRIRKATRRSYEIVLRLGSGFKPDQLMGLLRGSPHQWKVTAEALKLQLDGLSVHWYKELCGEIGMLGGK